MHGRMGGMKAISASIIVLAGSLTFAIGGAIQHSDTQMVVCLVGTVLGIVGLISWIVAMTGNVE
jgi:hypothetical protein